MIESHPVVVLARRSIECYLQEGRRLPLPAALPPEMLRKAGVFVSLHCRGELRGCIGTIQPVCGSVAEEVIENAIAAATRDPRFSPVCCHELADLEIKVDILSDLEPVESLADLDPKLYGLVVQSLREPRRRGLLLPDLEGIDTVEKQVHWTRYHKAAITDPDEPVQMYRFEVNRYS